MLCALGVVLLTGCGIIPTYVPPGYEPAAAVPATVPAPATQPNPGSPAPPAAVLPAHDDTSDTIHVGDKLIVTFADTVTPVQPFDVTVREDGMITLIYNQKIKAAGKNRGQLEDEIRALYVPKIFKQLTVSLRPEDRFFTVGGEVRMPARQIYTGSMTVLKGIAAAGGFTEFANKRRVEIIRANGKKEKVDAVKAQEDPRYDLPIYPGDQIFISRRIF
jgi:polysaccharide export outer membrane protein